GNDGGEERLVFQSLVESGLVHSDGLGSLGTTVDDGRDLLVRTTQAAARTFPQVVTNAGCEVVIGHEIASWLTKARQNACAFKSGSHQGPRPDVWWFHITPGEPGVLTGAM